MFAPCLGNLITLAALIWKHGTKTDADTDAYAYPYPDGDTNSVF